MKPATIILALIVLSIGIFVILRARGKAPLRNQSAQKQAHPEMYLDMRNAALHGSRSAFGLDAVASSDQPWGVLMEIGFPEGSATVVAFSDGSASIYLSSGGGSIGGIGHANIRKAAQAMVSLSTKFLPTMTETKKFPLPTDGQTIFYVLTDAGVLAASAPEADLGEQRHALSPLFYAGQEIITQYRLIEGKK
jgi:hypothetical protein